MYAGLFGVLFLMSQLFQTALGYSSIETGLRLLPWTLTPMFIAPVAGALADRYGSRPFMVLGLVLQAVGLRVDRGDRLDQPRLPRVRRRVHRHRAWGRRSASRRSPTRSWAACRCATPESPRASTRALRELGGVVGVSVLAAVFAARGGYGSAQEFVDGFTPAIWVAVGLSVAGVVAALMTGARRPSVVRPGVAVPVEA